MNNSKNQLYMVTFITFLFFVFTYIFINVESLIVYDMLLIFFLFLILLTASLKGLNIGLISSVVVLTVYGGIIFYQSIYQSDITITVNYFWVIVYPVSAFFAGVISDRLAHYNKLVYYYENDMMKYANIDHETGFKRTHEFVKDVTSEISKATRYKYPFTIAVIEILYFDELVAQYGEKLDDVFKMLSDAMVKSMRTEDTKYRIGEKTFAVLLPHTPLEGAMVLKKRIKDQLLEIAVDDEHYDSYSFEVKIGVKEWDADIVDALTLKRMCESEVEYDI